MTTIPTALLIIAGLIVTLLIHRVTRAPTEKEKQAQARKLIADRQVGMDSLRKLEDNLRMSGHPDAIRVSQILGEEKPPPATQPTGRKD